MQIEKKRVGAVAVALVLALGLTGCQNPIESLIENVIEDAIGGQIGGDVNLEDGSVTWDTEDGKVQIGESSKVPDTFPSRLPQPNGKLMGSMEGKDQWTLTYIEIDRAEVDRLIGALKASGFAEEVHFTTDDTYQATFKDSQFTVMLVWGTAEAGSSLIFTVTPAG